MSRRSEVWSFDINPEETKMVTLSNMAEFRIWDIQKTLESPNDKTITDDSESDKAKLASLIGTVKRQGRERGVTIRYSQDGSLLRVWDR